MDPLDFEPPVLRPTLYGQLQRKFGKVKVSSKGQQIIWATRPRQGDGRLERWIDKDNGGHWGECYVVCCPYCKDHTPRLYISYMWGHLDNTTGSRNLWLCYCQNEQCMSDYDRRLELFKRVWDQTSPDLGDIAYKGKTQTAQERGLGEPPGTIWPMDRVPPDDPAYVYLAERMYCPEFLSSYFGVGLILEPKQTWHYLRNWIYIPVFQEGELKGWQARYVGEPPAKGIKKYYNAPWSWRNKCLYNFDSAIRYPWVCVLEGATKVWRFGPEGVATFGKGFGGYQASLLSKWKKIVIMYDPNADANTQSLLKILRRNNQVAVAELPDDQEPDDMPTEVIRTLAVEAAAREGFDLC